MYGDGSRVSIERADNGYIVRMDDPKIVAYNRKRDLTTDGYKKYPYKNPTKEYVFEKKTDLWAFLEENMDKALVKDNFDSAFDSVTGDDDDG